MQSVVQKEENHLAAPLWPQLLLQVASSPINAYLPPRKSRSSPSMRRSATRPGGGRQKPPVSCIVEQPTGFLSTIQIGITTMAGFLGSAFAADNLAGRLSQWFAAQYARPPPPEPAVQPCRYPDRHYPLLLHAGLPASWCPSGCMKEERAGGRFTCGGGLPGRRSCSRFHQLADRLTMPCRLVHIGPNERTWYQERHHDDGHRQCHQAIRKNDKTSSVTLY